MDPSEYVEFDDLERFVIDLDDAHSNAFSRYSFASLGAESIQSKPLVLSMMSTAIGLNTAYILKNLSNIAKVSLLVVADQSGWLLTHSYSNSCSPRYLQRHCTRPLK